MVITNDTIRPIIAKNMRSLSMMQRDIILRVVARKSCVLPSTRSSNCETTAKSIKFLFSLKLTPNNLIEYVDEAFSDFQHNGIEYKYTFKE